MVKVTERQQEEGEEVEEEDEEVLSVETKLWREWRLEVSCLFLRILV